MTQRPKKAKKPPTEAAVMGATTNNDGFDEDAHDERQPI
jgi:hypothetical protein